MIELIKKHLKARCFFANKRFHALVCDSNHKKRQGKSSTIASLCVNGFSLLESSSIFLLIVKGKSP
jgi:hypothetical protein